MVIVINFKDYREAMGENAVSLVLACEEVAGCLGGATGGGQIMVAPHPTDLRAVKEALDSRAQGLKDTFGVLTQGSPAPQGGGVAVLSQSLDFYTKKGAQTGRMTPNVLLDIGVKGGIVNHAENPRTNEEILKILKDFKNVDPKFIVIVCAESVARAGEICAVCKDVLPDYIAIEPLELIGGDISVTTRPELIKEAVEKIPCPVLVGAGVKSGEDFKKALEFGAKGVLLASGIVKPSGKTPKEALEELVKI